MKKIQSMPSRLTLLFVPLFLSACVSGIGQDAKPAFQQPYVASTPAAQSQVVTPDVFQPTPAPTVASTPRPQPRVTYNSVNIQGRYIAMTFDDGPHKTLTPQLLDLLARKGVKATFFVVGQNVRMYPEIAARIVREGHEIANHTWSHPSLTKISQDSARSQFARTEKAIIDATGVKPRVMRPPYGAYNNTIANWVHRDFGYKNIMWNVDPLDWKRPGPSVVAQRLVSGASPGAILLAHDIHAGTIQAMPSVIDQLHAQGYKFVTVSQLIALETAPQPTPVPTPIHVPQTPAL